MREDVKEGEREENEEMRERKGEKSRVEEETKGKEKM